MLISNSWPSASSISSVGRAAGSPVGSVGNASALTASVWTCSCMSASLCGGGARQLCEPRACGNPLGDVGGVILYEAEQRRAGGVLPLQPEDVEPGALGHAATVLDASVGVGNRQVDPAVVVAEARRPHDAVDLDLAAVGERHRPTRRFG